MIVERFVFIDQSMVVSGKHDPRKGKNDVANFKTGTRVKRLRRSGALRPLVGDKITCFEDISSTFNITQPGKYPSETFYVTTDRLDFRFSFFSTLSFLCLVVILLPTTMGSLFSLM